MPLTIVTIMLILLFELFDSTIRESTNYLIMVTEQSVRFINFQNTKVKTEIAEVGK